MGVDAFDNGMEAHIVIGQQHEAIARGGADHGIAFFKRVGEGLFAEHVLAGRDGVQGLLGADGFRTAKRHEVSIWKGRGFLPAGWAGGAILLGGGAGAFGKGIVDGGDFAIGMGREPCNWA